MSCLSEFLPFNSRNSGNFHSIEKNKISTSELGFRLSKRKSISEIEQKAFVPSLIKRSTFFFGGGGGILYFIALKFTHNDLV